MKMDRTIQKKGFMKRELLLLLPFIQEPLRNFTLSEIKKATHTKSHHYAFETLKKFTQKKILIEKRVGNTNIYTLNSIHNESGPYLSFLESIRKESRPDIPYDNLLRLTTKIKSSFYVLMIGGSYASSKQKPTSDLDVAFIIPDSHSKKPYEIAFNEGELMVPEIHGYVFTQTEFYLMLINDEYNYGKELARNHILCYGSEAYYNILFEAIQHGFKG